MNTNVRTTQKLTGMLRKVNFKRGLAWGVIIIGALLAFEIFNYSTTEFALGDVLGPLTFLGIRWSTILAIAFCGIDFAGIARLFTPEQGSNEPAEVWYLFGAWLLAAGMNATLTWWGVAVAIADHATVSGGLVMSNTTLIKVVPIFVAIMVWLIRVLIIGTFSVAGDRLFSQSDRRSRPRTAGIQSALGRSSNGIRPLPQPAAAGFRPAPKNLAQSGQGYNRPEPTYRPISMAGSGPTNPNQRRQ